jgi:hypothetical protein
MTGTFFYRHYHGNDCIRYCLIYLKNLSASYISDYIIRHDISSHTAITNRLTQIQPRE